MTYLALILFSILCPFNVFILCSTLQDFDSTPSIRSPVTDSTTENILPYPVLFRNARQTATCRKGRWQCKNGECIRKNQLCDGEVNCTDGSDETFTQCRSIQCQSNLFRCAYGACTDSDARCNGVKNCADNSDEDNKICTPRPKQDKCRARQYQCNNGDCISRTSVCDGTANCKDGSDETIHQCSTDNCLPQLFRCAYGACVDGGSDCDNKIDCHDLSDELPDLCKNVSTYDPNVYRNAQRMSTVKPAVVTESTTQPIIDVGDGSACTVPPKPENGKYLYGTISPEPGQQIPDGGALRYVCNKNYVPTADYGITYCTGGSWTPENVTCYKLCRNLTSTTIDYTCTYQGENVPCLNIKSGTVATPVCKGRHYENSHSRLKKLKCLQGQWDNPETKCIAECGEEVSSGVPFIIGGVEASNSSSPWHIAIYDKRLKVNTLEFICGGTIITNKVVISAAHCFDRGNVGNLSPASDYAVAAGKRKRLWEINEDTAQKFEISKIVKHERFSGISGNLQNDIAILILEKIIEFNDFVHPACLDLVNTKFRNKQLATGNYGQVVGWGFTKEGDRSSQADVLMIAKLPVVNYTTCRANMGSLFDKFLSNDKLCAGHLNGTTVCQGDSGGGLVFPEPDQGTIRFYLRAIVSVGDYDDTRTTCKKNAYVAFTDVGNHTSLILETLENV